MRSINDGSIHVSRQYRAETNDRRHIARNMLNVRSSSLITPGEEDSTRRSDRRSTQGKKFPVNLMSKSEFKKSLEEQRKLVDAKEREKKARMEATEAAKMIANMVGEGKRITS